jgi:hypothetical protein
LTRQERRFVACFPLNVSIVHSAKPTVITDGNQQTNAGFAPGKTIHLGSLEFITDRFDSLSLTSEGNDSSTIFVGMVHRGSLSLHAILEEFIDEGDTTSSGWGSSVFPISRGCNMVTPIVPITITPLSESTLMHLTILTVPVAHRRTAARYWALSCASTRLLGGATSVSPHSIG